MDWIVTEIDGKVASIAADYRHLPHIAAELAALPPEEVDSIGTRKITTEELTEFARFLTWEDLRLFGSMNWSRGCTVTPSWPNWWTTRPAYGQWPTP